MPQPCVLQTQTGVHKCARWLGAGTWGLGSRLDEGTAVSCEETGMRNSTTGNARGGSPDGHRNAAPLLSETRRAGLPLQPLFSCSGSCPHRHQGGLLLKPGHVPLLSPPPLSSNPAWVTHLPRLLPDKLTHSNHYPSTLLPGWLICPNCCLGSFLPDRLMCSGNLKSRLHGINTCRGGAETTAEPQGLWNNRRRAEISPYRCMNHGVTLPLTAS